MLRTDVKGNHIKYPIKIRGRKRGEKKDQSNNRKELQTW